MLLVTKQLLYEGCVVVVTNRDGMQEETCDLLKIVNDLALSYREHLNGFARLLPYPRPIDFLKPMRHRIFIGGILCAKELIREGVEIDRRTIGADEHDRVTVAKGIGPTRAPVVLDRS